MFQKVLDYWIIAYPVVLAGFSNKESSHPDGGAPCFVCATINEMRLIAPITQKREDLALAQLTTPPRLQRSKRPRWNLDGVGSYLRKLPGLKPFSPYDGRFPM